ncbi:hypothetical protein ACN38_g4256 [Penicillium nordicum]|uniref:Uncharacterized protein n=1 Tax=Penicillium nordicum TaxID=229535 RepID=A0A0M8P3R9_9EURO|nr:hypothetical protein ACN38_g4256 [Penicillium nordicum]
MAAERRMGRATDLRLIRYKETLSGKVNPRYLNKNQFWASDRSRYSRSLAQQKKKKKKKNEHAQKSKVRENGKENRTFMPRGTGMGMADPSNQMQMNKDEKKKSEASQPL